MSEIIVSFGIDNLRVKAQVIRKEEGNKAFILTTSGEWRDASGIHTIAEDEKLKIDPFLEASCFTKDIDKPA